MMIKKLYSFLLLTCLLLFGIHSEVKATHAAGAEITYEWISGSTYKIIYTFYRSCAPGATTEPTTVSCCYYATCGGPSYTVTLTKIPGVNGTEVGTGCPGYPSQCSGPARAHPVRCRGPRLGGCGRAGGLRAARTVAGDARPVALGRGAGTTPAA